MATPLNSQQFVVFLASDGQARCSLVAAQHCHALASLIEEGHMPLEISLTHDEHLFSKAVVEKLITYLEHFYGPGREGERTKGPSLIPKPKVEPVEYYLDAWERSFLSSLLVGGDVRRHEVLIALLNMADRAGLDPLRDMLLAWVATQVEALSEGNGTMEAAEAIRQFFGIPNEWSDEEMDHLSREMAHYDESADVR